jgi:hypothetical protein
MVAGKVLVILPAWFVTFSAVCLRCLQLPLGRLLLLQVLTRLLLLVALLACRGACGHCSVRSSWPRSRAGG